MKLDISRALYCPLTHQIMFDPVLAGDGICYEREAIEYWFMDHDTSPMTNVLLQNKSLISQEIILDRIQRLLQENPALLEQNEVYLSREALVSASNAVQDNNEAKIRELMAKDYRLLTVSTRRALQEGTIFPDQGITSDHSAYHTACVVSSLDTVLLIAELLGPARIQEALSEANRPHDWAPNTLNRVLYDDSNAGRADRLERLVNLGAQVNCRFDNRYHAGETPIFAAARGHVEVVSTLIRLGADPCLAANDGHTPLHEACWHGRVEVARILLDGGASVDEISKQVTQERPLHIAARGHVRGSWGKLSSNNRGDLCQSV